MDAAPPAPRSTPLWGIFCACSWTWCIGMYLPVLLIERFGWPGFFAFAIPNVLGCSALALVVRDPARNAQLIAQHAPMMALFSVITIAYHTFFTVWLLQDIIAVIDMPWWGPMLVAVVMYALSLVFAFFDDRDWLALALIVYAISLAAMFAVGLGAIDRVPASTFPPSRLLWLIPTLCFGFLLCPYLDLTFHRAAMHSRNPRASFMLFGLSFAPMLLLTVLIWFGWRVWSVAAIAVLVMGHLFAQMIFTCGVHLRELRLTSAFECNKRRALAMLAPALGVAALPIAQWIVEQLPRGWLRRADSAALAAGADAALVGECTYLTFLFFYGMVFPAYVLLAMASRRPFSSWRDWLAFAALIVLSIPMYAAGFLFNRTHWLLPPLALTVVWFLLRRMRKQPSPPNQQSLA
jgi:hypothetical protein